MPFRPADESGLNAVISVDEGEVPYLIQYDTRWGYHGYGSSVMGITACGPTCLSMVAIGLTGDTSLTPARIADFSESAGHYVSGAGTAWTLFTQGASSFGLNGEAISTDAGEMRSPPRRRRNPDSQHAAGRLHNQRALHSDIRLRPLRLQRLRPEQR